MKLRNKWRFPAEGAYDRIIGIGQDCANASYLRLHCLRTFSSPFDWVAGWDTGFLKYADMICTDFEGFIEKEDLLLLEHPHGVGDDEKHDYYRNVRTGMGFYHDFPISGSLNADFPAVRAKYDRRIARFLSALAAPGRTLLVYRTKVENLNDEDLITAIERIRSRFPSGSVDLMVIQNEPGLDGMSLRDVAPGVVVLSGHIHDSEGNLVMGNVSLCNRAYDAIRAKGQRSRKFAKWRMRLSMRISSAFHFTSAARKAARERWKCNHQFASDEIF